MHTALWTQLAISGTDPNLVAIAIEIQWLFLFFLHFLC